jgi:hypothetical protein
MYGSNMRESKVRVGSTSLSPLFPQNTRESPFPDDHGVYADILEYTALAAISLSFLQRLSFSLQSELTKGTVSFLQSTDSRESIVPLLPVECFRYSKRLHFYDYLLHASASCQRATGTPLLSFDPLPVSYTPLSNTILLYSIVYQPCRPRPKPAVTLPILENLLLPPPPAPVAVQHGRMRERDQPSMNGSTSSKPSSQTRSLRPSTVSIAHRSRHSESSPSSQTSMAYTPMCWRHPQRSTSIQAARHTSA